MFPWDNNMFTGNSKAFYTSVSPHSHFAPFLNSFFLSLYYYSTVLAHYTAIRLSYFTFLGQMDHNDNDNNNFTDKHD